jgi:hypothetical protein
MSDAALDPSVDASPPTKAITPPHHVQGDPGGRVRKTQEIFVVEGLRGARSLTVKVAFVVVRFYPHRWE